MFRKNLLNATVAMAASLGASQGYAQAGNAIVTEEVVVFGVRASMSSALDIKRDNIQLVDSIVAEDIGKLPDNNVVEALQHVTGVQVGPRTNGEASAVFIRGMGQVATTINGRNAFTAAGRSFALADIPATLLAGVDVYKTSSADMVEGGIAGVIDVRTRRPFDFEGRKFAVSAKSTYSDQSDKYDPQLSVLASDRWETGIGEIGALVNLSYTKTNYRDQTIWTGAAFPYNEAGIQQPFVPGEPLSTTSEDYVLMRDAIGAVDGYGERERPAVNVSLQWEPSDDLSFYSDLFYTGFEQRNASSFLLVRTDGASVQPQFDYYPGTNVVSESTTFNDFMLTSTQAGDSETDGFQYAVGGEWDFSGNLKLTSELVYQTTENTSDLQILDSARFGDTAAGLVDVDFNTGNGTASLNFRDADLTDATQFKAGTYFDNRGKQSGDAFTWTADAEYFTDGGVLDTVKFGLRYDSREAQSDNVQVVTCCTDTPIGEIPEFISLTPGDFFQGDANYPKQWYTANPDYLLDNTEEVRALLTSYSGAPAYDPTEHFVIEEESLAAYAQTGFVLGNLDGVLGVRAVQTDSTLEGYEIVAGSDPVLRSLDSDTLDVLPSLTVRYNILDDLVARFNASKTLTRPAFGDLNPSLTLRPPIEGQTGTATGFGGNIDLESMESVNFDLGLEWYFADSSALTATVFHRELDGLVESAARNVDIDGDVYQITRPENAGEGILEGLELGFQYFPDNVPSWMQGVGLQTSYTYIDGHTESAGSAEEVDLVNVSENAFSAVLVYEKDRFSARYSYVWRDDYINGYNYLGSMPAEIITAAKPVSDVSISYDLTDDMTVTLDATNIFGDMYTDYFGDETLFNRDARRYSKTVSLGVRAQF